ncbi:FAD-dependent monooxygenase [Mycobacterium sp. TNTM28]|uniref:FAD-dependent monooxygenase n=1 Tax=[Mycobacterium] fortunisiensis TaxID=2600579 RepID=A0ABS6KLN5_9MYCO|nr:NAD(P)/FAD-dependent oxidoreductase [[Mycobacterium] fortunisiensis]MBU9764500.1 FAD-dependent monooxygenase [[Mycobacterium] fortunisiensis]
MDSFDVIVVGGRCAGSALAIYLARAGIQACVVDKATFPSETPSTHVVHPRGVAILADVGVLTSVLAEGAAQLDRMTLEYDDVRIDGFLGDEFSFPGLNVRRTVLDHALQQEAKRSGVEVRTGCRVNGVRRSNGRVVGVETADGPLVAPVVVGADGRGSIVAKSVAAREYLVKPAGRIPVWGYFAAGPQEPRLRVGIKGNLGFLASPTDSNLYLAGVTVDRRDAGDFQREREANFCAALRAWPEIDGIVRGTRREGPLRVMANWHNYFRESAGPGWVLVGDAGHFKDFTPAQGIADALCQAKSLAGVIVGTFGAPAADEALRCWWRARDRSHRDMYWFALQMGRAGMSSPLTAEVLHRISDDPHGATTLLKVLNHDLPSSALLTPRRLVAATYTTLRKHPHRMWTTLAEIGGELAVEVDKQRARHRSYRAWRGFGPADACG